MCGNELSKCAKNILVMTNGRERCEIGRDRMEWIEIGQEREHHLRVKIQPVQVYHLQSALEREREDGYHCDLLVGKRIICRAKEYMAMLNAADARRCQCSLLLHNKTPSDRMQVPVSLMIAKENSVWQWKVSRKTSRLFSSWREWAKVESWE